MVETFRASRSKRRGQDDPYFISMLCTILKPTSGKAWVNGFDVLKEPGKVRKSIGIVFQQPSVDDLLTGRENLVNTYSGGMREAIVMEGEKMQEEESLRKHREEQERIAREKAEEKKGTSRKGIFAMLRGIWALAPSASDAPGSPTPTSKAAVIQTPRATQTVSSALASTQAPDQKTYTNSIALSAWSACLYQRASLTWVHQQAKKMETAMKVLYIA